MRDHIHQRKNSKIQHQENDNGGSTTEKRKTMSMRFEKRLLKYKELPEYLQDNEYIIDYYRCEWPLKDAILSVFSWHNETLNIWTHLLGFMIFAGLMVISCIEDDQLGGLVTTFSRGHVSAPLMTLMMMKSNDYNVSNNHTFEDSQLRNISRQSTINLHDQGVTDAVIPKWPWFVFLFSAMGCLVCSSISHLLACHSKRFNLFFWRLDYAGISLMIVGSFFAPIYYAFYCNNVARFTYLTSITIVGTLAIITLLAPVFSSPRYRNFRATLFLSMGFSGIIPAAHAVYLHWGHPHIFVSLGYELAMAVLYASGAAFYVTRIPERWKPGVFDIAGHSHQIFHVFVVLAALAHSAGTLVIMDFRKGSPACIH